jgi:uncharacterized protein YecE (DUF72 family)
VVSGSLYVGTSGFSYPVWRGGFYPEKLPASRMLDHYARRLTGVELNGSFYRTPPEATLVKWAAGTPPGFRLCFKGHRALTYSGEAFDKERVARDIGTRLAGAGDRLGPLLLQFPPTRQHEPGLLDRLLAALGLRAAVEFRHASWFADDVYRVLRAHGAALVVTDSDEWPVAPRIELPFAYYRLRRMGYDGATLKRWRSELRAEAERRDEVHAYFRHEPEAPFWALSMLE